VGKGEVKCGANEEGVKNGKRGMVIDGKRGRAKGGKKGEGLRVVKGGG
jgi:hypothetical protein